MSAAYVSIQNPATPKQLVTNSIGSLTLRGVCPGDYGGPLYLLDSKAEGLILLGIAKGYKNEKNLNCNAANGTSYFEDMRSTDINTWLKEKIPSLHFIRGNPLDFEVTLEQELAPSTDPGNNPSLKPSDNPPGTSPVSTKITCTLKIDSFMRSSPDQRNDNMAAVKGKEPQQCKVGQSFQATRVRYWDQNAVFNEETLSPTNPAQYWIEVTGGEGNLTAYLRGDWLECNNTASFAEIYRWE